MITTGLEPCLVAYPLREWEAFEERLSRLPQFRRRAWRMLKRIYVSRRRRVRPRQARPAAAAERAARARRARHATCCGPAWARTSSSGTRRASRRSTQAVARRRSQARRHGQASGGARTVSEFVTRDRAADSETRRSARARRAPAASTSTRRWAGQGTRRRMLEASAPDGKLFGIDRDPVARSSAARERLARVRRRARCCCTARSASVRGAARASTASRASTAWSPTWA